MQYRIKITTFDPPAEPHSFIHEDLFPDRASAQKEASRIEQEENKPGQGETGQFRLETKVIPASQTIDTRKEPAQTSTNFFPRQSDIFNTDLMRQASNIGKF